MTANRIAKLLQMVSKIADPAEAIREEAAKIAADARTDPETAQACRDLAVHVEGMFAVAGYLLKKARAGE